MDFNIKLSSGYYEKELKAVPYISIGSYTKPKWEEFQKTPLPAGATPADIKKLTELFHVRMRAEVAELNKEYNKNIRRVTEMFRNDLELYYLGTINFKIFPMRLRDKLWEKAWEEGHSNGFSAVNDAYSELATIAVLAWDSCVECVRKTHPNIGGLFTA